MKLLLFLCVSSVGVFAQITPKFSNEYLHLGIGSRSYGMGKAQVSNTFGAEASYWNPSRMIAMDRANDLSFMHARYFAGIANFDYLGYSHKLDTTTAIGLSFIRLAVDDIPDTRYLYDANGRINYDNIAFFSAADIGVLLSFSRKINGFSYGLSGKIIRRSVGDFASAWGFGLDAGFNLELGEWQLAGVIRDVTTTFTRWNHNVDELEEVFALTGNTLRNQSDELTLPRMIMGISRSITFQEFTFIPSLDVETTFDGERNVLLSGNTLSLDPRAGVEIDYRSLVYLRAGVFNIQRIDFADQFIAEPTIGAGLRWSGFRLDYALSNFTESTSGGLFSHVVSLGVEFDQIR